MTKKINLENRLFFFGIFAIVIYFAYQVASPVLNVILLALITVFFFTPVYNTIEKRVKSKSVASMLTTLIFLLTVIIPIILISVLTAGQVATFVSDISKFINQSGSTDLSGMNIHEAIAMLNLQLNNILPFAQINITIDQVRDLAGSFALPTGEFLLNKALAFITNVPALLAELIIFIILISYLFPAQNKIRSYLMKITPWDNSIDNLYLKKIRAMSNSMIKGTFAIAIIQGVIAGIILALAGVEYVIFWTILSIFMGIIPVGSGFINIPIGIVLLLTGNVFGGLLVILGNIFIVNTIDNILRPKFVSEESMLNPALVLIGVLGGIQAFGFFGFIYGPISMILLVTTLELYRDLYKQAD